jgi:hypothetical protein
VPVPLQDARRRQDDHQGTPPHITTTYDGEAERERRGRKGRARTEVKRHPRERRGGRARGPASKRGVVSRVAPRRRRARGGVVGEDACGRSPTPERERDVPPTVARERRREPSRPSCVRVAESPISSHGTTRRAGACRREPRGNATATTATQRQRSLTTPRGRRVIRPTAFPPRTAIEPRDDQTTHTH